MGFDAAIYSYISNELQIPALKMAGRFAAGLELGDQLASFCILFIMAGYLWQKPRLVKTFTGALFSLAAGGIAVQIFKHLIGRARPAEGLGDMVFIGPHFSPGGYDAFPSGHTTAMFALLGFVCRFYPAWTVPLYIAGFLLSLLGRVITGQHFLTDVVGGAVLGLAVGIVLAARWRAAVEAPPSAAPTPEADPGAGAPRRPGPIAMLGELLLVSVFSSATLFIGAGSEFAPHFPSALMGLLTALAVYFLARRLCGADTALYSALILSSSFLFVNVCRLLPADTAWLFFTTLAFTYYAYSTAGARRSNLMLALAYASIGLALLAKGPPALYAVAVFLLYEYLSERPSLKSFLLGNARRHALFLGAALLAAAPWIGRGIFSYEPPAGDFFFDVIAARAGLTRHAGRVIYYPPLLLAALFPWTFFALAYLVQAGRRWSRGLERDSLLLFLWALPALGLFPFVAAKTPHFLVIALPPLSLLLGRFVGRGPGRSPAAVSFSLLGALFVALSSVVAAAVLFRVRPEYAPLKVAAPFAVLAFFLAAAWLLRKRPAFFAMMCLGALGFYASAILIALGP